MFETLDVFDFKHINRLQQKKKYRRVLGSVCLFVSCSAESYTVLVTCLVPVLYNMSLYYSSSMCLLTVCLNSSYIIQRVNHHHHHYQLCFHGHDRGASGVDRVSSNQCLNMKEIIWTRRETSNNINLLMTRKYFWHLMCSPLWRLF